MIAVRGFYVLNLTMDLTWEEPQVFGKFGKERLEVLMCHCKPFRDDM